MSDIFKRTQQFAHYQSEKTDFWISQQLWGGGRRLHLLLLISPENLSRRLSLPHTLCPLNAPTTWPPCTSVSASIIHVRADTHTHTHTHTHTRYPTLVFFHWLIIHHDFWASSAVTFPLALCRQHQSFRGGCHNKNRCLNISSINFFMSAHVMKWEICALLQLDLGSIPLHQTNLFSFFFFFFLRNINMNKHFA